MTTTRILTLALGAVLLSSMAYAAAPSKTGKRAATDITLATELHDARVLLATALHDYDGHRAAAFHQVGKAVHQLHKDAHKPLNLSPVKDDATQEDQATSDAQLKKALGIVQTVQGQLAGLPAAKHRTLAAQHLATAASEINKALAIK
jgi:hypothetical protein